MQQEMLPTSSERIKFKVRDIQFLRLDLPGSRGLYFPRHIKPERSIHVITTHPEILCCCYTVLLKVLKYIAQQAQHILESVSYSFFTKLFPAEFLITAACFQLIRGVWVRTPRTSSHSSAILGLGVSPSRGTGPCSHHKAKASST